MKNYEETIGLTLKRPSVPRRGRGGPSGKVFWEAAPREGVGKIFSFFTGTENFHKKHKFLDFRGRGTTLVDLELHKKIRGEFKI